MFLASVYFEPIISKPNMKVKLTSFPCVKCESMCLSVDYAIDKLGRTACTLRHDCILSLQALASGEDTVKLKVKTITKDNTYPFCSETWNKLWRRQLEGGRSECGAESIPKLTSRD